MKPARGRERARWELSKRGLAWSRSSSERRWWREEAAAFRQFSRPLKAALWNPKEGMERGGRWPSGGGLELAGRSCNDGPGGFAKVALGFHFESLDSVFEKEGDWVFSLLIHIEIWVLPYPASTRIQTGSPKHIRAQHSSRSTHVTHPDPVKGITPPGFEPQL
ncbi:hypothetical protein V6N12_011853 [Hibiscus sabdariffa]|uniref:Uncharacterized protein n=1 Tax=Hibiscus sabdariffa TaxID=183260 RepID=A0ABR2CGE3_9ROSI